MELLMQNFYMKFFLILVTLCSLYKIFTPVSTGEFLNLFDMSISYFRMSWKQMFEATGEKISGVINIYLMTIVQKLFMIFCIYNAVVVRDFCSIVSGLISVWMSITFGLYKMAMAAKHRADNMETAGKEQNLGIFVLLVLHQRKFNYYVLLCVLLICLNHYA